MIYYIKSIRDSCVEYTTSEEEALNGKCKNPQDNERFRRDGTNYWETRVYHKGEPKKQGWWYDCIDKDGNEVRLMWFVCNLNAKKRYYMDTDRKYFGTPADGIKWSDENVTCTMW